jgi:hemoglobin
VLGGPASYTDEQIRQVHRRLDIRAVHIDALKAVLAATLADHGIAPEDVDAVVGGFEQRRPLVVARP